MKKEKYFYIYKTTNLINDKIYIGQHSTFNINDRYLGSGSNFQKALKKYGKENFKCEILEFCNSREELNEREIFWIEFYNSHNRAVGYNLIIGSKTNCYWSEEYRLEQSIRCKELWNSGKMDDEIKKIRERMINNNPMIDPEVKLKIIASLKETWELEKMKPLKEKRAKECRDRSGKNHYLKDKNLPQETINKISKNRKGKCVGEYHPMWMKHHKEESIEKMRKAHTGKILTEEHKRNIGIASSLREYGEDFKNKMRIIANDREELICSHCSFIGKGGSMYRWHFNNCKLNPNKIK